MAAKLNLTEEQRELFNAIESELRQECAIVYIQNGYENKLRSYVQACENLGKKPSKNPDTSGAEMLGYPSVTRFIDSVRIVAAESVNINAAWVLTELKKIHSLDILDIMNDDLSGFKALSEWPKIWRTSISGLDLMVMSGNDDVEAIVKKIKWPDKTKNLEMIGKHVNVKAWDKEQEQTIVNHNIMPVPTAASAEDWEKAAQDQQAEALSHE